MLTIERVDPYTKETNRLTLPITERQLELYESGQLSAVDAFPNLTCYEREFIISGITEKSWKKFIDKIEESDEDPNQDRHPLRRTTVSDPPETT